MEAKINGELIVFDHAGGEGWFDLDRGCWGQFHKIYGGWEFQAPDGHLIVLNFKPVQGVGTYDPHGIYIKWDGPYNDGSNNVGYNQYHFCPEDQTHYAEEGEVTITSIDNDRYKGTFHFIASNICGTEKVLITEGKFEINQESASAQPRCFNFLIKLLTIQPA